MLVDAFAQLAAGLRLALVLFGAMVLISGVRQPVDAERWQRWKSAAWMLIAVGVVSYSPAHAAWLLGHPTPKAVNRALDAFATGCACASFIVLLGARGLRRGLSLERVMRGMAVNVAVALAMVGAAWITR